MNRDEFNHAVRAAASVLNVDELIVIGSQAVHASISSPLPDEAQRSVEVDILPMDDVDGAHADLIDGSIGEASMFHARFGIYAQGVGSATAVLPDGIAGPPEGPRVLRRAPVRRTARPCDASVAPARDANGHERRTGSRPGVDRSSSGVADDA